MSDFLNKKMGRTEYNTDVYSYNCGGYALSTYTWYLPYREWDGDWSHADRINDLLCEGASESDIYDTILDHDRAVFEEQFADRNITFVDEDDIPYIGNDVDLIAYRFYYTADNEYVDCANDEVYYDIDTDFHFRVRRKGVWYEKRGMTEIRKCEYDDYWPDYWQCGNLCYDSPILYFTLDKLLTGKKAMTLEEKIRHCENRIARLKMRSEVKNAVLINKAEKELAKLKNLER